MKYKRSVNIADNHNLQIIPDLFWKTKSALILFQIYEALIQIKIFSCFRFTISNTSVHCR